MMKNRRLLVSGSTGFVGSHLVERLLADGNQVTALVRKNTSIDHPSYHEVLLEQGLPCDGSIFDGVIHLATLYLNKHQAEDIPRLVQANILFGLQLLDYAATNGIGFFINTATFSQSVLGEGYQPQSLYAATKQAMEDLAAYYHQNNQVSVLTMELCDTYGPGDMRPKFLKLAVEAYKKNEPFKMSGGEQEINYTYIDDVVDGFVRGVDLMMGGFEGGKYALRSATTLPLYDLVVKLGKAFGRTIEIERGFYPYRPNEIMSIKPQYPLLPGWSERIGLEQGLQLMVSE